MKSYVRWSAIVLLCLYGVTAMAQTTKELTGTWAWVSVETTLADGRKIEPFGPQPSGYVVFDGAGHFAYVLSRSGRAKFAANSREHGSAEENMATVRGTLAMS